MLWLSAGAPPDPARFNGVTVAHTVDEAEAAIKGSASPIVAVVDGGSYNEGLAKVLEASNIVVGSIILSNSPVPKLAKKILAVTKTLDGIEKWLGQAYNSYMRFQRFFDSRAEKSFYGLEDQKLIISSLRMKSRTDQFTIFYPLGTRAVNLKEVLNVPMLERIELVARGETNQDIAKRLEGIVATVEYLKGEPTLGMKEVIKSYTMPGVYFMLNLYLRYGKTEGLDLFREYMFCLKGSMCELGTPITEKGTVVYRGLKWDRKFLKEYEGKKGEYVLLNGFVSTSLTREVAVAFANNGGTGEESTLLEIRLVECDEGYIRFIKGFGFPEENGVFFPVNISEFSAYNSEKEVLFPPFYPMRIVNVCTESFEGKTYSKIMAETPSCVNISGKNRFNNILKAQTTDVDWKKQYIDSMLRLGEKRIIDKLSLVNLDFLSYEGAFSRVIKLVGDGYCAQLMIEYEALQAEHLEKIFDKGLGALRKLCLNNTQIGSTGVGLISRVLKSNPALQVLELAENKIDRAGFTMISDALKTNTNLAELSLMGTGMEKEDVGPMGEALSKNTVLAILDLSYNNLENEGVQELAKSLNHNESLLLFNAMYNHAPEAFSRFRSGVLENRTLVAIHLEQYFDDKEEEKMDKVMHEITSLNGMLLFQKYSDPQSFGLLSDQRKRAVAEVINYNYSYKSLELTKYAELLRISFERVTEILKANTTITSFSARRALANGQEGDKNESVQAVLAAISAHNRVMTQLDLSENTIHDSEGDALGKLLANDRVLRELNLASCTISGEVAASVVRALSPGSVLRKLNLSNNELNSTTVGDSVANMLNSNGPLEWLDISHNDLGDKSVAQIVDALIQNTTLSTLKINATQSGKETLAALAKMLRQNKSITKLGISENKASDQAFEQFCAALSEGNRTLAALCIEPGAGSQKTNALGKVLMENKVLTGLRLEGDAGNLRIVEKLGDLAAAGCLGLKSLKLVNFALSSGAGKMLSLVISKTATLNRLCLHKIILEFKGVTPVFTELKDNKSLTHLCFRGSRLSPNNMELLCESLRTNTVLSYLSVKSCNIDDDRLNAFVLLLKTNKTLSTLVIEDNPKMGLALIYFGAALIQNTALTTLYIDSITHPSLRSLFMTAMYANKTLAKIITSDGINHLAIYKSANEERRRAQQRARAVGLIEKALKAHTTHNLRLDNCSVDAEGLRAMIEALKGDTFVKIIELSNNMEHGDECAVLIADMLLVNKTVQSLKYDGNGSSGETAKAFAGMLMKNTTLKELILGLDNIGDEGAKVIFDALKVNTSVEELALVMCNIGDACVPALAEALKTNRKLKHVMLGGNRIGNEGAKMLADVFAANTDIRISELNLGFNQIGKECAKALQDAARNASVDLDHNFTAE